MIRKSGGWIALLLAVAGCAQETQYEDYKVASIADLYLTATNHPHGYGKQDCFLCHVPSRLHRVNRLNSPNFDLAPILVEQSGVTSCAGCHGPNGVSP